MIFINRGNSEFHINDLELFIRNKTIQDLKWFVKNVVKISDNKEEVKEDIEYELKTLMQNRHGAEWWYKKEDRFIKKVKRLLQELEKI